MVRSIQSDKVAQHTNPVPNAAVLRGLLVTSGILGKEIQSGQFPKDSARQFELVFQYLGEILKAADAGLQDVVKLDLYFRDKKDRSLANPHWVRLWPDPQRRPARQSHVGVLPKDCMIEIVATAVLATPDR